MFSLKTILFAATAALAGVASAAPLVDAHAKTNVNALVRSLPESGSSLVARCDTCNSVPAILTPAIVKLDGILAQASKWWFVARAMSILTGLI